MKWKTLAKNIAYWTTPPAIQDVVRATAQRFGHTTGSNGKPSQPEIRALLERNRKFRNKHAGQRCFVLATGPSIRSQDLTPLKNELCIAVSEFYKHEHYSLIKPAYYAFAPNHPPFTDEDALRELHEMRRYASSETFFFGIADKAIVERSGLVTDSNRVHYLDFGRESSTKQIDLTTRLPPPYGAGIIATWIAIYLGFSEIYLVGCDHDHLWKWDGITSFTRENYYQHFYDGAPTTGHQPMDVDRELKSTLTTRQAYRSCGEIALRQGTRIYSANPRNYLNVVPTVPLSTLF